MKKRFSILLVLLMTLILAMSTAMTVAADEANDVAIVPADGAVPELGVEFSALFVPGNTGLGNVSFRIYLDGEYYSTVTTGAGGRAEAFFTSIGYYTWRLVVPDGYELAEAGYFYWYYARLYWPDERGYGSIGVFDGDDWELARVIVYLQSAEPEVEDNGNVVVEVGDDDEVVPQAADDQEQRRGVSPATGEQQFLQGGASTLNTGTMFAGIIAVLSVIGAFSAFKRFK